MSEESSPSGPTRSTICCAKRRPPASAVPPSPPATESVLAQDELASLLSESAGELPADTRLRKCPRGRMAAADMEFLLDQAQQALDSVDRPADSRPAWQGWRRSSSRSSAARPLGRRRHARADSRRRARPEDRAGPHAHAPRRRAQAAQGLRRAAGQAGRRSGRYLRQRPADRPRRGAGAQRQLLRARGGADHGRSAARAESPSSTADQGSARMQLCDRRRSGRCLLQSRFDAA